ncbi:MAG: hypothetical protein KBB37_07470, partial [Bacteroidia bacterium]|nr:hypothetical protein [Bacteroidia bacterium]MBP9724645.1 hypothetical protein [Bacteroidia bacterium]
MRKNLYLFLALTLSSLLSLDVYAQTPTYLNGTPTAPGGNSVPFSFGGTSQVNTLLFPAGSFGTV